MGVPAFFRWLSRKYPSIVVPCQEDKAQTIDGYQVGRGVMIKNYQRFIQKLTTCTCINYPFMYMYMCR